MIFDYRRKLVFPWSSAINLEDFRGDTAYKPLQFALFLITALNPGKTFRGTIETFAEQSFDHP
jgi:hypothetical protein